MKLAYKKVFNKYETTFTDKLAERSYKIYKRIRLSMRSIFPLSEIEEYSFREKYFFRHNSNDMPKGFDYKERQETEGTLTLDYIDFYDYLPKEDLACFKKELIKYSLKNKINPFSSSRSRKDFEEMDRHGWYSDGMSFSNLLTIQFKRNKYLMNNCTGLSVSIQNLSTTFLVVKYRVHISEKFNSQIAHICKSEYCGGSTVYRKFDTPWYAVRKFGRAYHTGDDVRKRHFYKAISELKWQFFSEIRKYFSVHFEDNKMFPPVFETYSTNIRPSEDRKALEFWDSIMLGFETDYSTEYNACIHWDYRESELEGFRLAAYCGGNYSDADIMPEIMHHDISDLYALYLVSATLEYIAKRDIAKCNKKISQAMKRSSTTRLLKVRVAIERKMYYSYRFVSEFSGKAIDLKNVEVFKSKFYKKGSISSSCLNNISISTREVKNHIDEILKLLDNAAEYRSSKSNIRLQWMMMIVTVVSLMLALVSIENGAVLDLFISVLKMICKQ